MARNTESTSAPRRASTVRVPRSRGALTGILLVLLGAAGALVPFVGPYFHVSYSPDTTWHWTTGRLWLEVVPGAATFLGGLMLLSTANRAVAVLGGWLATAGGAWFVVGPIVATLSTAAWTDPGTPVGSHTRQVVERLSFFDGLGVVILILAAHASGRLSVRSVRDVRAADRRYAADADDEAPTTTETAQPYPATGQTTTARTTTGQPTTTTSETPPATSHRS
jgi:hypothetical protein